MPLENQNYALEQNNYTSTTTIPFMAAVPPGSSAQSINWTLSLNYHTSLDKFNKTDIRTFVSQPGETVPQVYQGLGGLLTVNASAVINGTTINARPITITITGPESGIPDGTIDLKLLELYAGHPTARLMIGLAHIESTYLQFKTTALYGRTLNWPNESYDGGSHIGLMMVITQMDRAWNWLVNTTYGVWWFLVEKTRIALDSESAIKANALKNYKAKLPDLDPVQRENMVLEAYGEGAGIYIYEHYYFYVAIPLPRGKYECQWIVNSSRNPKAVNYVNNVRLRAEQY